MLWNVLERTCKLTNTVNPSTFFFNFPNFVQLGVLHFLFTTQAYAQDAKWKKLLFIEMEIRSRLQPSAFSFMALKLVEKAVLHIFLIMVNYVKTALRNRQQI